MIKEKTPVSGSEINTYLLCQRRWLYAHHPGWNLEPNTLGPALTRGLIGHKALETFYEEVMQTGDWDTAAQNCINRTTKFGFKSLNEGDSKKFEMVAGLIKILSEYFIHYKSELQDFEVLAVEELVRGPLKSPVAEFVGRVDVTIKYKRGPWKGETAPFDHKFVYNFWPDGAFMLNAQMPNYVWGVRNTYTEAVVKRAIVNQLRHRDNATERFNRRDIVPTRIEIDAIIDNHSRAATEVVAVKRMDPEDASSAVMRNISKFNCEYCPFIRMCKLDLIGEDTTIMRKTEFKKNSYGYAERNDG